MDKNEYDDVTRNISEVVASDSWLAMQWHNVAGRFVVVDDVLMEAPVDCHLGNCQLNVSYVAADVWANATQFSFIGFQKTSNGTAPSSGNEPNKLVIECIAEASLQSDKPVVAHLLKHMIEPSIECAYRPYPSNGPESLLFEVDTNDLLNRFPRGVETIMNHLSLLVGMFNTPSVQGPNNGR